MIQQNIWLYTTFHTLLTLNKFSYHHGGLFPFHQEGQRHMAFAEWPPLIHHPLRDQHNQVANRSGGLQKTFPW